jgi:phosphatidylinositol alpha 1,6-mannosyltransferase
MTQPTRPDQLRIAMFSGNYNYVRDGANQALNRLVGFLLRQGAAVRIYSATNDPPAFAPTGDLVSVPSIPIPGRGEYRVALGLPASIRDDIERFRPNMIHVAAPDYMNHRAVSLGLSKGIPVLASMHTRFETYFQYYGLGWMVPTVMRMLRRFYNRCDVVLAPSPSMADMMRDDGLGKDIGIWARGIDTTFFNPERRSLEWRRSLGIADDEVVIGFLGRLVMEKGLDVFADAIRALAGRGIKHRVLVIGDGPARGWLEERLPDAVYVGFQSGADLGRAAASLDMLFNPSVTETFGNVTLEVMACALPVIAARATGSQNLVTDGVTGRLITPGAISDFADVLERYATDAALRTAHGKAGAKAAEAYDWDEVNRAVLNAYLRIAR